MAWHTLDGIATHPKVKLACVADVDSTRVDRVKQKYPDAKIYQDWRQMLVREKHNIDVACISTPDHMHAPQALSAMRQGLPVYLQKPLTHDLHEARRLADMAHRKKLVTQMGIQIHSRREYKIAVALVRNGAIGKIKEVHSWSEKKWGDPDPLPDRTDSIPSTLAWDQWLGVATPRSFIADAYHPLNWRKRLDFGTATFGDMGCHILDPVVGALGLTTPISVRSEGAAPNRQSWALHSEIRFVFQGTSFTADSTMQLTWYDGDRRPPAEIQSLVTPSPLPGQGSIFVGTKGAMLLPHVEMPLLFPAVEFAGHPMPAAESDNHYHQFVEAVLGNTQASAPFSYSGLLTEIVLLGALSTRFPKTTLDWRAGNLKFHNMPEANDHVARAYRDGWKVKGLG
jgi:predicted dehydrogenase